MALEEQLLTVSLTDTFHDAQKVLDFLYRNVPQTAEEAIDTPDDYAEQQELLCRYVEKAFRDVAILAERLELPILAKKIAKARKKIKSIGDTSLEPEAPTFYSPPLQIARSYFDSLRVMTEGRDITA